ncbi:hypothetical protein OQA88_9378 [Cercophora sp. LCS_1]
MSAPKSRYKRNVWYMAFRFNPDKDHIGCERDNEAHSQMKLKLAPGVRIHPIDFDEIRRSLRKPALQYSGREIVNLEEKVDANIAEFLKLLETSYLSAPTETKAFDLAQKVQYFTADTIGDIAFGKPIGFLQSDTDMYDYLKTSAEGFPFFTMLSLFPWLMHILALDFVKKYMPSAKDTVGMGRIMGLAGAETTATAIRMTLFHVYSNPRILSKLRAEIRNAQPSSPITNAEASNLVYLQAVIKEATRIYPPITGDMLKDVPPEGDTYNGQFLPGGTTIGYSMAGMLTNKKTFGEDAETFRPERFLEGTENEIQMRNATVDGAFGYGRWRCLGRNIALMELNKIIPEIIRTFDFSIVYPTKPFKNYNAGIQIQWDMWMRATRISDADLSS